MRWVKVTEPLTFIVKLLLLIRNQGLPDYDRPLSKQKNLKVTLNLKLRPSAPFLDAPFNYLVVSTSYLRLNLAK